ncbi:TetR/AcrR family transcriptional regulator [Plantactinospora endophytica]|uniref:TetR family transcriptional regulator n=1 Tax=Plantactinospora endophytica TaxID=673535 RepID=A0ABQ4DS96_9ACTN|nr:TetR/AcrR family transcriptional regulator [Plantactinospora endophytica]GIG85319.1 TetR family transcriptional regulator [Plantactinospora endophytica]
MAHTEDGRPLRADARRNRDRVLRVAAEVFASEGLAVPVQEIARRAGVGTGTVSRHFPTKESLFAAILLDRVAALWRRADELTEAHEPGTAFFALFGALIEEGANHRGLAEALAGAGYDLDRVAAEAGYDVAGRLRDLLDQAQRAGAVRADIGYADVKALLTGCLSRDGDAESLRPLIAVITQGLRP